MYLYVKSYENLISNGALLFDCSKCTTLSLLLDLTVVGHYDKTLRRL